MDAVAAARAQTPADFEHAATGFAVTVGAVLHARDPLLVPDAQDWAAPLAGVTRARLVHVALVVRSVCVFCVFTIVFI